MTHLMINPGGVAQCALEFKSRQMLRLPFQVSRFHHSFQLIHEVLVRMMLLLCLDVVDQCRPGDGKNSPLGALGNPSGVEIQTRCVPSYQGSRFAPPLAIQRLALRARVFGASSAAFAHRQNRDQWRWRDWWLPGLRAFGRAGRGWWLSHKGWRDRRARRTRLV